LVPWRVGGVYWEKKLREIDTPSVGVYMRGRSVRELPDDDFAAIVSKGLNLRLGAENEGVGEAVSTYFEEPLYGENTGEARQTVQVLSNKKLRDQRFRSRIVSAYNGICAFTGTRMQDYNGHHEVQAAHILSVAENGPDVTSNGLALSSTIHWMFDRHLVSIDENLRLLVADTIIPIDYLSLLESATKGILLPKDRTKMPNQKFIRSHRSKFELRARLAE
jgi:putative restriction endonuclease